MTLKYHKNKLNDRAFSIGISKKVPENGANLAFISSPKITNDNISIVNEFSSAKDIQESEHSLFYANQDYLLENEEGISSVPDKGILITDEFTTKVLPNDIKEPLFYIALLKNRIKAVTPNKNILLNSIPYQYGYETRTLEQLRAEITSTDKTDITPLIHIIDIRTFEEKEITSGYKLRLIKDEAFAPDAYEIRIYNNFDPNITYKATYKSYNGEIVTEIIKSSQIFQKAQNKSDVLSADIMENIYAMEQNEAGFNIYAPTELYLITDDNRKPYEFKYRILANLKASYSNSNPVKVKIGLVYLNNNGSDDIRGILPSFVHEIGNIFPDYISFINPHPPLNFWKETSTMEDPMEYFGSNEYWEVNLEAPQHFINDYDIIIITGYGMHNLSAYNETLDLYLMQGGKIIIDNASNNQVEVLRLDFGPRSPIIEYDYDFNEDGSVFLVENPRDFIHTGKYRDRYYNLLQINHNLIAYYDSNNVKVSPRLNMSEGDLSSWSDILRYGNGGKSIGYKNYKDRGKILLSNCGILKSFCHNTKNEAKMFVVNAVLSLIEEKWVTTPWTLDRLYDIDQLYDNEISSLNYIYDISSTNKTIAKKIISSKVKSAVSKFVDSSIYGYDGVYHVEAQEYKTKLNSAEMEWGELSTVYIPTTLSPNDPLYAYATASNGSNFSIDDIQGYSKSQIKIYNESISFKFMVRPFTYVWRNVNGIITQEKLYGSGGYLSTIEKDISRSDGLANLGILSPMIPQLPGGPQWADHNNIFFEVRVGYFENGGLDESEQRVNIRIYDKVTGQYKFTKNGENIISYNDLYAIRRTLRSNGSYFVRRKSEDIIVQASTNYYILSANKRTFAIKQKTSNSTEIQIPEGLNTNENWYPRVKYVNFTKNSFEKEDYDRIAKTLGFRFEKDYISERIKEFYGEIAEDDVVAGIIAKLDGDQSTLSEKDSQIISEAFDIMGQDVIYEYNTIEYHRQAWDPYEPFKRSKNEVAKYIDNNTIKVQYPKIHVINNDVTREKLEQVSPSMFKSVNLNWKYENVKIEVEDIGEIGGWRIISPNEFNINFDYGLVTFDENKEIDVYASYSHSTISIQKRTYVNSTIVMEELIPLDSHHYDIFHYNILKNPAPIVYLMPEHEEPIIISPSEYEIDYERGFLRLNHETTSKVLVSYSYSQVSMLSLRDYDRSNGIIELTESISFQDSIFVTYYYEDDFYDYKGFLDGDRFMYLDLNPTRGHTSTISTIDNGILTYKEVETYELLDKTIFFYLLPWKVIKNGMTISENRYTIRHTFDEEELKLIQLARPEAIVIGNIRISNDYTKTDIYGLDARSRGGGLKENISIERIGEIDELSLNFWDVSDFDGRKYYPNGMTVIKLPKEVLGKFTKEEVQGVVEKHLACGVFPIIKYY